MLKKEDKIKFVELLLIVGGILGAFKLTGNALVVFVLFLVMCLAYFVLILSKEKHESMLDWISTFVAASFSGIIAVVLSMGVAGTGFIGLFAVVVFWIAVLLLVRKVLLS